MTHVIFSHVVTGLHRFKAKDKKSANGMGSSQEYNVWNMISQEMILCNDSALYRVFSTLIPILKKSITAFLLQHIPRMAETSLRASQAWKSGTMSWVVNQDKMTQIHV